VADQEPDRIRVTLVDSSRVEMMAPVAEADSLIGRDKQNERVAVAVENVVAADERITDAMATGVLLIAIGAFAYYWIHAYCCTGT
jgi:hypothetical protein